MKMARGLSLKQLNHFYTFKFSKDFHASHQRFLTRCLPLEVAHEVSHQKPPTRRLQLEVSHQRPPTRRLELEVSHQSLPPETPRGSPPEASHQTLSPEPPTRSLSEAFHQRHLITPEAS